MSLRLYFWTSAVVFEMSHLLLNLRSAPLVCESGGCECAWKHRREIVTYVSCWELVRHKDANTHISFILIFNNQLNCENEPQSKVQIGALEPQVGERDVPADDGNERKWKGWHGADWLCETEGHILSLALFPPPPILKNIRGKLR